MHLGILLISKIYSFLFCLRYLPFRQAIHIPILIHPSVKIERLHRGCICFSGNVCSSMFVFGFPGTIGQSNCQSLISINKNARLIVKKNVTMVRGTRLVISQGLMSIGENYFCNGDCVFNCTKSITIGDNCFTGWNVCFNTSDGHHIFENGIEKQMEGDINIGNHVWIASYSIVGKNAFIADDCVVAQHSLVCKRFEIANSLIGGMPAKVIKENYTWSA